MIYKKEALELLKKGATIEFTTWGDDYPIYIRYGDKFERLHRAAFWALRGTRDKPGVIKRIKVDGLSQTWVIK